MCVQYRHVATNHLFGSNLGGFLDRGTVTIQLEQLSYLIKY